MSRFRVPLKHSSNSRRNWPNTALSLGTKGNLNFRRISAQLFSNPCRFSKLELTNHCIAGSGGAWAKRRVEQATRRFDSPSPSLSLERLLPKQF